MDAEFWIIQSFNGISYGALLFLLAGGLSLIFGVMRIVNLAHGSYFLLGGYVALLAASRSDRVSAVLAVDVKSDWTEQDAAFAERFRKSPVKRAKRRGLLRNVAVALGNSGDAARRPVLERLAEDEDPDFAVYGETFLHRLESGLIHRSRPARATPSR